MATIILAEPQSLYVGEVGANLATAGYDILPAAKEGTVTIAEGEVTRDEKKNERGDIRYVFTSKDPITVELEIDDFGPEIQEKLLNRTAIQETIDGVLCDVFQYTNDVTAIYKQLMIRFKSDNSYFKFPKLQTFSSLNLASIATETGATNITMTAYPDENGVVAEQVIPKSNVGFSDVAISAITATTATAAYKLTLSNGATIESQGVVYAKTAKPTIANTQVAVTGTAAGSKTASLTGLTTATQYYVRPFAMVGGLPIYGDEVNFTTL